MNNSLPSLPDFEYIKPATFSDATQFLVDHPTDARPFLGGTDCFVRMRDRAWQLDFLVDVKNLPGMNDIKTLPSEGLVIGAAVNMNRIIAHPEVKKHFPVLAEAASQVAGYQLRTRATVVGNICNASPCGDTIGPCLAYDGVLSVQGSAGERIVLLKEFFIGPGKTVLKPGDIVQSIFLPFPPSDIKGKYLSIGRNAFGDLAIVAVTVLAWSDATAKSGYRFRLYLSAVAPTVIPVPDAEKYLLDHQLNDMSLRQVAVLAMNACNPISDIRSSKEYRREMVKALTERALHDVVAQIGKKQAEVR